MRDVEPRSVTEVDKEIGERMRQRRRALGLSQAYVADVIGITFQQLQKYESGQNRVASATFLRIADALSIDPVQLMPGGKKAALGALPARASEDPIVRQLKIAFSRIVAPKDRALVLKMARELSARSRSMVPQRKRRGRTRKG